MLWARNLSSLVVYFYLNIQNKTNEKERKTFISYKNFCTYIRFSIINLRINKFIKLM